MLAAKHSISERDEVLRVSEVYASIQGEGPRTGMGTLFVRFGGCNLRCPGWPCDTLYAVLPEYRQEWERRSPFALLPELVRACNEANLGNVCFTGGEPFIQNANALKYITDGLLEKGLNVEAFSNGQVHYPDWAFEKVHFIMDWKLPGSGNQATELTANNVCLLKSTDAVKFVIGDVTDYNEAVRAWKFMELKTLAQWWAGVVWEGGMTEKDLIARILDDGLPWNVNTQVHKYIWSATKRGV
jgi:7-carboxy-7-deazaguanine synthase